MYLDDCVCVLPDLKSLPLLGVGRKSWYIIYYNYFLLDPVFFRTALSFSGGYHLERGRMPLHDAVGIICKKGATTENQGSGVRYMD